MLIYATMCVKNEEDVVETCIKKALKWADHIFVINNNSNDGTEELILNIAKKSNNVTYLSNFYGDFQEGVKSIPFNWVKCNKNIRDPDWWAVLDSDEYYLDNPRVFLKGVPKSYGRVCTQCCEFLGLIDDKEPMNPRSYESYIPLDWSESRFFRNYRRLKWSTFKSNGPENVGATYGKRIQILHFPFRSKSQIEKRLKIRKGNNSSSGIAWKNSMFNSVDQAIMEYKVENKRAVSKDKCYDFLPDAKNFMNTKRDMFLQYIKRGMYLFGFYR